MKTITMDVLKDAANRLLFDMSEDEYKTLYEEFRILTKQMETIGKIEGLEEYPPMTFPFDCSTTYLREDVAEKPLPREEALANAGSKQDNQIKLPKVVL
ncbi:MAG: Asp-tRNA(Asn)/Glu-tRNA(Gln) amidotransferase GatCAB subunit C [Bacilli bacterium]|jgi:aspartyl/glutamyl-tRNA(Asn/Gln) amidotransferase C subunit|nr:Asp-tRNA(Asn)/Glu-tRNA(Gln) amidotransferase GatCAB subunit C [Bacilli bacterium]